MSLSKLKKASQTAIGVNESLKAVEEGAAKMVFIAQDADDHIVEPLKQKCNELQLDIKYVTTMKELGQAAGIEVNATSACIID
ncbi:L7Ae/L30e/S12e/Gadd45 family ribosomal protein [Natranaerobius thermophilus]|uniref:Ribosomal protein L7Ae/L30e/S12e/Gadd45 n=1 Tax=Natranaerobius thermophilus (strain ATCC BAA-1301 / DSM 18059 / JW/NM-WN-LF) TaxID=457570 RepID=B2A4D3_NATTJ|nr:ribosomal L7Ae/L30e/S12e/Gadd45 family protein [Natranaerobius thermophilus]ACB83787.1 ribosomal protein L7Ae/L30e/S12e/Gadd45 [Natranaerobius thermophilus JW/NM-WN-LF]